MTNKITSAVDNVSDLNVSLQYFINIFFKSKIAIVSCIILTFIIFMALLAPIFSPQNPYDIKNLEIIDSFSRPGKISFNGNIIYLLGTDYQGRDILSLILLGIRISLMISLSSTCIALTIGLILGLISGYLEGWVKIILMRITNIQLAFPAILIALILLSLFGGGIDKLIIALVITQWTYYARSINTILTKKKKEYIEKAKSLNLSVLRIICFHILPNCISPLIIIATLQFFSAISLEAILSFLGLGVEITKPSLGLLTANSFQYFLSGYYWMSFYPGIVLLTIITSINLITYRLRNILNNCL
ncbi:ABC transporter permease [Candidatus Profftella armatura]